MLYNADYLVIYLGSSFIMLLSVGKRAGTASISHYK